MRRMAAKDAVYRLSVAPMMDWTDRHYRFMMRHITKKTLLFTEMLVDQTLLHQQHNLDYFLGHDTLEAPLALQLGGNGVEDLGRMYRILYMYFNLSELIDYEADAAKICQEYGGFCEIDLNSGCPSPLVSSRCFGARLMLDPERVRDICKSMIQGVEDADVVENKAVVTVKCRIGVDDFESYEFLHDYIATVACSGVKHFIVHARKCLLNGLSPHENRTIPPLKYEYVYRLKNDFPDLFFTLNGGIQSVEQAKELLDTTNLDGIMVGRAAYTTPWHFRHADRIIFDSPNPNFSRREIIKNYLNYAEELQKKWGKEKKNKQYAMPTSTLMKPLLNLFNGEVGGKAFKRHISAQWTRKGPRPELREMIISAMEETIPVQVLDARPNDEL